MILLAFAGIALVVATFSIHNTFSILVAQRTRESALLRAIGASRRQVVTAVAVEALVVGVVASAIGFGVGLGLAAGLQGADGRRRPRPARRPASSSAPTRSSSPPSSASLTTLVASVAPALKASRVAPLAALRDVAVDRSAASTVAGDRRRRSIAAAGVATVVSRRRRSTTVRVGPGRARRPRPCSSAPSSSVRSSPARPPPCSAPAPASTRGFTGRLARRNAMRNPRRIAGQRLGADGRHRRGGPVHHVRRVDQGVDRRHRRRRTSAATCRRRRTTSAAPASSPAAGRRRSPSCPRSTTPSAWRSPRPASTATTVEPTADRPGRARRGARPRASPTGSLADVGPGELAVSEQLRRGPRPRPRRRRCR